MAVEQYFIVLFISGIFSLIFTILRNKRYFVHHGFPDFIEFFGYGLRAYLLFYPIAFFLLLFFVRFIYLVIFLTVILALIFIITKLDDNIRSVIRNAYCNFIYNPLSNLLPIPEPKLNSSLKYVIFSFDVEEDCISGDRYLNSYKYIDFGVLEHIAKMLYKYGIRATFYVTPNVARDRPDALKILKKYGHEIGLHIHVHTLRSINYPYILRKNGRFVKYEDMIKYYSYDEQLKIIKIGKSELEKVLNENIYFYRSGYYSCSMNTEKAVKTLNFKAIANHKGVYYISPIKLWNIGRVDVNIFSDRIDKLVSLFNAKISRQKIINIFTHPMNYYNHKNNCIDTEKLRTFLEFLQFLDGLKKLNKIKFVSSSELVDLLNKNHKIKGR